MPGKQKSIVIVISPLVSLMEDQVARLSARGIASVVAKDDYANVQQGLFQLVFISPEALFDTRWHDILRTDVYQQSLIGVAIDEAHCIKEW